MIYSLIAAGTQSSQRFTATKREYLEIGIVCFSVLTLCFLEIL